MFKTWKKNKQKKTVFIYIDVFSADPPFVNAWHLCLSPLNSSDPFPPQHALIWHCEEYVFQNRGVPCNYRLREEETKLRIFGLMCWVAVCSRLLVVSVRLLVVCGLCNCFLVFCGRLLVVCGRLLVVCVRLLVVCSRCLF